MLNINIGLSTLPKGFPRKGCLTAEPLSSRLSRDVLGPSLKIVINIFPVLCFFNLRSSIIASRRELNAL